jgi:hypothetical protein
MPFHRWLSRRKRPGRAAPALLTLLATLALACGCASPDEPTARHPIVPQAVQDLQTHQQGAAVALSFTLPGQSTRKEPLAAPPAVEIYRGEVTPGLSAKAIEKAKTKLLYTIPGEMVNTYSVDGRIVYHDAIAAGELARTASGSGTSWVYLIRTRAARNRASAESNRVVVRIHPAPEGVSGVSARVAGQSVTLTWPREVGAAYRVYRAEIAPESAEAAAVDASKAILRMPLVQVAQTGGPANGGNATSVQGGLPVPPAPVLQYQDENVELGHAYLYIVRRVAQYEDATVESEDSPAAVITVVQAVPPAAPQDVQVVIAPATGTELASVSLSWAIGSDASLAGYAVYRSEQEGVRGVQLNEALVGAPTYRDASVAAGRRYFYSVTAIDAAGQESAPSTAVEAQIPATQP